MRRENGRSSIFEKGKNMFSDDAHEKRWTKRSAWMLMDAPLPPHSSLRGQEVEIFYRKRKPHAQRFPKRKGRKNPTKFSSCRYYRLGEAKIRGDEREERESTTTKKIEILNFKCFQCWVNSPPLFQHFCWGGWFLLEGAWQTLFLICSWRRCWDNASSLTHPP